MAPPLQTTQQEMEKLKAQYRSLVRDSTQARRKYQEASKGVCQPHSHTPPAVPCHVPHQFPLSLTGMLGTSRPPAALWGPMAQPWGCSGSAEGRVSPTASPCRQGEGKGEGKVRAQPLEALCHAQPVCAGCTGGCAAPPAPLPACAAHPARVPLQPAAGDGPCSVRALHPAAPPQQPLSSCTLFALKSWRCSLPLQPQALSSLPAPCTSLPWHRSHHRWGQSYVAGAVCTPGAAIPGTGGPRGSGGWQLPAHASLQEGDSWRVP